MDIFDVMYNCCSMCWLDKKLVFVELLVWLVDVVNQVFFGFNMQIVCWIVIIDDKVKKGLVNFNCKGVESYIGFQKLWLDVVAYQLKEKRLRMLDVVIWQMEYMYEMLVIIMVCIDFGLLVDVAKRVHGGGFIWLGVQNLLFVVRVLGLGAILMMLVLGDYQVIFEVFNLFDMMVVYCLILVGYFLGRFGLVSRKLVEEIMCWNQWS